MGRREADTVLVREEVRGYLVPHLRRQGVQGFGARRVGACHKVHGARAGIPDAVAAAGGTSRPAR